MAEPTIRQLAERHWQGDISLADQHHPLSTFSGRAAEELQEGVFYLKSLASVTAVDSGDGLVFLDTGSPFDTDIVFEEVRQWRPDSPMSVAVFSHHHIDHVFGTLRFEEEARHRGWLQPRVFGHEAMAAHFDRYERTQGWNAAINQRQFAIPVGNLTWPSHWRRPDVTYSDTLTLRQGNLKIELHHARGETDDATWTWIPQHRLLHAGDLFLYCLPNAGNPQKVQRYLSDWAHALREMAALGAELMVSGHGLPIFGSDRIAVALLDTAEVLDSIENQTIALMNTGCSLDRVLHEVVVPEHLRDKPYLRAIYDHPQFLVRNVWRRYGGWYDGEPDNLLPAPRSAQASTWVALAGGIGPVIERALELAAQDELALACHLVEAAVLADPSSSEAHIARTQIYSQRAERQESLMARNILRHAASASQAHQRDLAGNF